MGESQGAPGLGLNAQATARAQPRLGFKQTLSSMAELHNNFGLHTGFGLKTVFGLKQSLGLKTVFGFKISLWL